MTPRARETSSPDQKQAAALGRPDGAASHGKPASSSGRPAAAARGRERDGPRIRRSRVAHRTRGAIPARCPVLITLRVLDDVPPLRRGCLVRAFRETLRKCATRPGFRVIHYSIQDDHAHFIVEAAGAKRLANGMKSLAARFARCVNRVFGRKGKVLADRFHHVLKRTPTEVRRALAYVLLNARKHFRQRRRRDSAGGAWTARVRVCGSTAGRAAVRRRGATRTRIGRRRLRRRGRGCCRRAGGGSGWWIRRRCRAADAAAARAHRPASPRDPPARRHREAQQRNVQVLALGLTPPPNQAVTDRTVLHDTRALHGAGGLSTPCPWCRSPSLQEALWSRGGQPQLRPLPVEHLSRRNGGASIRLRLPCPGGTLHSNVTIACAYKHRPIQSSGPPTTRLPKGTKRAALQIPRANSSPPRHRGRSPGQRAT